MKKGYEEEVGVPNAPCGVESMVAGMRFGMVAGFLMHRVELKVLRHSSTVAGKGFVPNAPCGVESVVLHQRKI